MMKKHFVKFYSPGTFVAEITEKPIDSWDIATAVAMARSVKERYAARPYAFQFVTRAREDNELDSHEIRSSGYYYLGGTVRTLAEVERDNLPGEKILRSNMSGNGYDRIITCHPRPLKWTQPLRKEDVVLPVTFDENEEPVI